VTGEYLVKLGVYVKASAVSGRLVQRGVDQPERLEARSSARTRKQYE
jgi:hypothetical protein